MQGDTPQSLVNLWVRDLDSNRTVRVTPQSGLFAEPAWSPGGDRIVFLCQPKGVQDICIAPSGGGGEPRLLYESSTWKNSGSFMPDGKRLLFSAQDPDTDQDIMMLPGEDGAPTVILKTNFVEQSPVVSPDGSRMAYESNESGGYEVYVRNLEGATEQWQVSTDGGTQARWRADGRELFYSAADGGVMVVPMQPGAGTRPGVPVRLFMMPERPDFQATIFQDVTPDGQRILLNIPTTSRTSVGFHAIRDWTAMRGAGGN